MEQSCTTLAWIDGKEHEIIVDNESETGDNDGTFQITNKDAKKAISAILTALI